MSRFLTFLTAIAFLAIVQAVVAAVLVGLLLSLLFFSATRPRETLLFVGALILIGLASARPAAVILAFGATAIAVVALGARKRRPRSFPGGGFNHRGVQLDRLD